MGGPRMHTALPLAINAFLASLTFIGEVDYGLCIKAESISDWEEE